jgi:hypothetical protein
VAKDKGEKKPYRAPELEKFGTVSELTQVGQTNPGGDVRSGSVDPPPEQV